MGKNLATVLAGEGVTVNTVSRKIEIDLYEL
jgi:hypothetical protein